MHGTAQTALILALLTASSTQALAHGGPQESLQIMATSSPSVVRTNYGLLRAVSETDWRWTCEEVTGTLQVTDYSIDEHGSQILSNFNGLYRSTDGCQWDLIENDLKGGFVTDLERTEHRLWATTGLSAAENGLWVSEDGGLSFYLDSDFGAGSELRSVKHNGSWMWVTGWTSTNAWAAHRETSEGSWTTLDFVHEDNPIESIRVHQVEPNGQAWIVLSRESNDELWQLSPDGAFNLRLDAHAPIEAVMMSGELGLVGTRAEVAWQSIDGGSTWTEYTEVPDMGCLASVDDTIHICSHNWRDGAAAMAAPLSLHPLDEWEWSPTLWYGDVQAVETCPEDSTVSDRCVPLWPLVVPAAGYNLDSDEDSGSKEEAGKGCNGCARGITPGSWLSIIGILALIGRRPQRSHDKMRP
jgi:hypothetical protein